MKIKIIFPFLILFIGISILLGTIHKVEDSKEISAKELSSKDLYIRYIIKPMDIHKKHIPLILEKLEKDNFNFDAFKESLKIKNPRTIKKILLKQEMYIKDITNSEFLNIIVIIKYRISGVSLNERVLEIIHGL
jgi:hypothetical protein